MAYHASVCDSPNTRSVFLRSLFHKKVTGLWALLCVTACWVPSTFGSAKMKNACLLVAWVFSASGASDNEVLHGSHVTSCQAGDATYQQYLAHTLPCQEAQVSRA